MTRLFWYLQNVELFRDLSEVDAGNLSTGADLRLLEAGATIEAGGGPEVWAAIVREGEIQVFGRDPEGEEYAIGILGPGDLYGEHAMEIAPAAAAGDGLTSATDEPSDDARDLTLGTHLRSETGARVFIHSRGALEAIVANRPELGPSIRQLRAFRFRRVVTPLASLLRRRPRARLGAVLLANGEGEPLRIGLSRNELGILSGMGRDVLDHELDRFARLGLVRARPGAITVVDRAALEGVSCEVLPELVSPESPAPPGLSE